MGAQTFLSGEKHFFLWICFEVEIFVGQDFVCGRIFLLLIKIFFPVKIFLVKIFLLVKIFFPVKIFVGQDFFSG
jgi:hypothetical protein